MSKPTAEGSLQLVPVIPSLPTQRIPTLSLEPQTNGGGRIHMVGICGSSMSGLALLLKGRGFTVTGSTKGDTAHMETLLANGIQVTEEHNVEHVAGSDLVVYSHAIYDDNVELVAAREMGIPVISRSTLLGRLSAGFGRCVCVCGTHGKTTVTSMLAQILVDAGTDPTVHIGGVLPAIGGNVRAGKSDLFLTEACEYQRSFLSLQASDIVLLNIDADHLDYYRDIDEIEDAFGSFLNKLPPDGWALGNGEDERVLRQLGKLDCRTGTFGASDACDYRMKAVQEDSAGHVQFDFCYGKERLGRIHMAVPGLFNAKNALAALAQAHTMGIDMREACRSIEEFTGARRRFELTGTLRGAELFHDYSHNPAEMRNALSIARKRCREGRLWAVVQPHTYSRVKALFEDYLSCTQAADVTLVTDIYGAREHDPGDIDSSLLVEGMRARGVNAHLTPGFEEQGGAHVFCHRVEDPRDFGVIEYGADGEIRSYESKPRHPKSPYAITGLFFFDHETIGLAQNLGHRDDGSFGIPQLLAHCLESGTLHSTVLDDEIEWFDAGTPRRLLDAASAVQAYQEDTGRYAGSVEQTAFECATIDAAQLSALSAELSATEYGSYLANLARLNGAVSKASLRQVTGAS